MCCFKLCFEISGIKLHILYSKKLTNFGVGLYENQSNNFYFSTSTSNIAFIHILLHFFQNMCLNYVHIFLLLYDINTGGSAAA